MKPSPVLALFSGALLCCTLAKAQNELDAYRYSATGFPGTSRSIGAGGAFSAVGADFSAVNLNPAGLALYRRSDLMFTPRLRFVNNTTDYMGETMEESRTKFGFANVGYVNAAPVSKWNRTTMAREEAESGLKSYAFGLGFNQIHNFNRETSVSAYNSENSITEYFAAIANGRPSSTLPNEVGYAGSAWDAGLIDTSGVDGNYVGAAMGGEVQQDLVVLESGRINEWNLAVAGNFDDLIYGGLSVGIQDLRYDSETFLEESDVNDVHNTWANDSTPLAGLSYSDVYATRGTGINVHLGIILRPVDFLRIGLAFTSPTWMSLSDEYYTDITGNFDNDPASYGRDPEIGTFSYALSTPYKITVGAMALFQKLGFISADFDFVDYSTAEFNSRGGASSFYSFQQENANIRELFDAAYNLRLGGELRFGPGRFRLGYANFGGILKDEFLNYIDYPSGNIERLQGARQIFTGGLGIKQESYYLDIAYAREVSAERRLFYTVQDPAAYSPELIRHTTFGNFYMTIGFTF